MPPGPPTATATCVYKRCQFYQQTIASHSRAHWKFIEKRLSAQQKRTLDWNNPPPVKPQSSHNPDTKRIWTAVAAGIQGIARFTSYIAPGSLKTAESRNYHVLHIVKASSGWKIGSACIACIIGIKKRENCRTYVIAIPCLIRKSIFNAYSW